jgi:hypothetical protein
MLTKALEDIRAIYQEGASRTGLETGIRKADVLLWAKENSLEFDQTFNQVSVILARGYLAHELDWAFCDAAANDLFGAALEIDFGGTTVFPDQFWDFYLAFDHSETVTEDRADETARQGIRDFLARFDHKHCDSS